MAVSPQGDVVAGSFYALDPTIVPWDLTNPIYKYVGVTLIVSNFNSSSLTSSTGVNITGSANTLAPYRVILIIEGVQRNTLSIVSDVQTIFGMAPGSFQALVSNPLTLPISVFGTNITANPYSSFVNKFVSLTSTKSAMIGKYSSSLLQTSSSAIIFNSLESLVYPISPAFSASTIGSQVLGLGAIGAAIAPAFGLNSTGVVVVHKKAYSFNLAQDYTIGFGSLVGINGGYSATNETFVASFPDGAQVKSFSPVNMLVQSGTVSTLVIGAFPWVGTAQRLLPDVSVTFHYPAFDSPYLSATWAITPSAFNVGQPFNLSLAITNSGAMDANNLHFTLGFTGVVLLGQQTMTSVQFTVGSLLKGASFSRLYNFQSFNANPSFSLSADFLDSSNYVYQWSNQYSPAPNVKQSGGLTVTKSISPTSPSYGQVGNVTASIHNNNLTATYFNIIDLNPDAEIFLYPQGVGNTPAQPQPCPALINIFSPIVANSTYFTFQVKNGVGCAPTVLTHILLQPFGQAMQLVASPNMLLGGGETWSPLRAYLIPGGPVGLFSMLTLRLTFQNYANITSSGQVGYTGALPQYENPKSSYLGLDCFPCSIPSGGSSTIAGLLENATGKPIANAPILLSYKFTNNTVRPITTVVTNATGAYSANWLTVSTLPVGSYRLVANYTGSPQNNAEGMYIQAYVITPTSIAPGGTITLSYPYFFNVTGSLSITPERIVYSSRVNATGTNQHLIGEYVAQSTPVAVTIGPPMIVPVVDIGMNVTKISIIYVAQNQSFVQVNLRVTNNGPQLANNVVVSSLIPQGTRPNSTGGPSIPFWLPVTSLGPSVSENGNLKTVSFTVASLPSGQTYSTWYVVKANATGFYQTASNVTAQSGSNQYKFYYTGPLLEAFSSSTTTQAAQLGLLKAYVSIDPAVVANKTSTTVTLHLYNAGNVTYYNIIATVPTFAGRGLNFSIVSKTASNLAPGSSETVNFTATAMVPSIDFFGGVSDYSLSGTVSYNQSSTKSFQTSFNGNVPIYDPTIVGFNPGLKIVVSAPTSQVSAGSTSYVIVTITNTGSSNLASFSYGLQAYGPLFNPSGPLTPETSYGSYFQGWAYNISSSRSVSFRVGIQTTAGGAYPVYESYVTYRYSPPGSVISSQSDQIAAATSVLITATDTAPPSVSTPWSSPFAPTSTDQVHVWTQVYDGSGVSSVNLEYSTDRLTWTSVPMTPLFGSIEKQHGLPIQQPFFGDIYNVTIPPTGPGAAVFYRIRASDSIGNTGVQDNNGNDYVYFIQGGNSWLFPNQPSGTNMVLNGTQYVQGIKTSIFLNVSTPIAVQVIQLPSNPGGPPPPGLSPLGLYTQVNANLSITLGAKVRFYYTPSQIQGLNASTIAPYYWNGASWIPLSNVSVNTAQYYVEGTVTHFSLFGVFAKQASTQPPPTNQPVSQQTLIYVGLAGIIATMAIIGGILLAKKRKRGTTNLAPSMRNVSPPNL